MYGSEFFLSSRSMEIEKSAPVSSERTCESGGAVCAL